MKNKSNLIFFIIGLLLLVLFLILLILLNLKKKFEVPDYSTDETATVITEDSNKTKTVKEIIEDAGSIYISESGTINLNILVKFKYDLFDENGKSQKSYFYDIIEQIEDIENKTFYIKDNEKKIEIEAIYDPQKETYKVSINKVEDFFDVVDSDVYLKLSKNTGVEYSNFNIDNVLIRRLGLNSCKYAYTDLTSEDRVDLGNGYFSFNNGTIIAKLQNGKALNVIFKEGYEDSFAKGVYVTTSLSNILDKYNKPNFGSLEEGYLGYITNVAYIFFYKDEVSVYPYQNKENKYFDEYILNYCQTGNLEKLVSDFTTNWDSYFEKEYDLENKSFRITFPLRGIEINISNNNSNGIIIYSNYYLTDGIKDLIKAKKINFDSKNDYIHLTEKNRRNAM